MPQVAAPQATQSAEIDLDTGTTPPEVDREFAVTAPRVSAPEAEVAEPTTDTEPAAPPQTLQLETELSVPTDVDESTIVTALEEPVLPATTVEPPQMPSAAENVVIATQPTQPASEVGEADVPTVEGIAEDALVAPAPEWIAEPAPTEIFVDELPFLDAEEPEVAAEREVAEVPVPEIVIIPEPETIPDPVELPTGQDAPSEGSEVPPQTPTPVGVAPEPTEPSVTDESEPTVITSGPGKRIKVNRPSAEPETTPEPETEAVTDEEAEATDLPALQRFATAFENPNGMPLLSILLVDDGTNGDMAADVASMPLPVTVVLHALDPNAAARMQAYRAAGIEVALQTSLPEGAVPTDVEIAFEAAFGILHETVMLFSDGTGVLQNDRAVTDQVMQILASDGRGLVTVQRGLGSAQRAAEQVGVAATTVLRDLDGAGEDQSAIERALDQSALRARQTGDAVLLGRVQPETISALTNWALTVNQDQMLVAPVSAVLLDGTE
ncbi:divergent polysaccharide deacetylase family protein [Yoonia maritima]|uniref:divergent polysaccharide deacetylase family protein n=1 Tax=Yoonia maritima TaxID=1435347 RepID=UPI0037351F2C